MRLIDIGGPVEHGHSVVPSLFPPIEVTHLPTVPGLPYTVYHQTVRMHMQSSTYLETGAHLYPDMIKIDELPLRNLFLNAVVLKIPLDRDQHVTPGLLQQALARESVTLRPRDAILVATGWDKHWNDVDYSDDPPHFTNSAMKWIVEQGVALFGTDTPRVDGRRDPEVDYAWFFRTGVLFLVPLVNLMKAKACRCKLIVLPMKVVGACAAPPRAILIEDEEATWGEIES